MFFNAIFYRWNVWLEGEGKEKPHIQWIWYIYTTQNYLDEYGWWRDNVWHYRVVFDVIFFISFSFFENLKKYKLLLSHFIYSFI